MFSNFILYDVSFFRSPMALKLGSLSFLISLSVDSFRSEYLFLEFLKILFLAKRASAVVDFWPYVFYGCFQELICGIFSFVPNFSVVPARIGPSLFNTYGYGLVCHPDGWCDDVTLVNKSVACSTFYFIF